MKQFNLEGRKMNSVESIYQEIERVLAPSMKRMGRNLHAFRDVLRGGFGAHDDSEKIQIRIVYKKRMRENLGEGFAEKVIKILKESENIEYLKGEIPKEEQF